MRITLLSPYHGGSHQAWAEGYRRHSRHDIQPLTLPARFWKWRMHGGAVTLARRFQEAPQPAPQPDLLLATDMLDLTTFLALTRSQVPAVLYLHENQLTYPLPPAGGPMRRQHGERDLHYAFINYVSMLAATAVWFNSDYHRRSLLGALPRLLKHFPDYNELESLAALDARSRVMPVGIDYEGLQQGRPDDPPTTGEPPLILWNQRWEYDKNPAAFFRALYQLAEEEVPFRVALCGQNFRRRPEEFDQAQQRLGERVVHVGYAEPAEYRRLLWTADITISTAHHEFFGISILEAMACHTFPILPARLSYPELLPQEYHLRCLYQNEGGLLQRLRWALQEREAAAGMAAGLTQAVERFAWPQVARDYDQALEEVSGVH